MSMRIKVRFHERVTHRGNSPLTLTGVCSVPTLTKYEINRNLVYLN
jgi:hypothetical protein